MSITAYGNPESIEKVCEWTGKTFSVDWKHRNRRFIDIDAMYAWRKAQNHESVSCKHCGKTFSRRKREIHWRSGVQQEYCSNICSTKSKHHINKAREWSTKNQPMRNPESRKKISITKMLKYGDPKYNNKDKTKSTCLERYGVTCYFDSKGAIQSNGRRISKFQRKLYEELLKTNPDILLEEYLPDVNKSVDIYISSKKKIIECYGDYWHCNPKKYAPDYYNKSIKMTAQEKWNKDAERICQLTSYGYDVEIHWETD
jgi:hypothetical protein